MSGTRQLSITGSMSTRRVNQVRKIYLEEMRKAREYHGRRHIRGTL
jgi:hypothetical protein